METKSILAKNIYKYRKQNGFTQLQLAQLLGVSAQAVSKWEQGLSAPDISLLPELAELLGITISELFFE